mmetsp:Transcript_8186/g.7264  ORF Transcript_8186/g.7264 Transcript_8186/m.7264 type:complete len:145 (+) Transcript_8186:151-585(+)
MPALNPRLKRMYSKDKRNKDCPLGFMDSFKEVQKPQFQAIPKTVRDPRYLKIKKAFDNSLKKPENYHIRSNIKRYRERLSERKSVEVKSIEKYGVKYNKSISSRKQYVNFRKKHQYYNNSSNIKSPEQESDELMLNGNQKFNSP